MHLADFS